MRPRDPPGCSDLADYIPLFNMLAGFYVNLREVQKGAFEPMAMIEEDQTALEIHPLFRQGDNPRRRRAHGRSLGGGDINAGMRPLGLAIEDALGAENTADRTGHRPVKPRRPIGKALGGFARGLFLGAVDGDSPAVQA